MTRVHVLQHVPFEGLAAIAPWLAERGLQPSFTRFFEGDALPVVNDVDLIIALGGPMSVNDELDLPWLVPEKQFVRDAIAAGKAVLGVCLGAQLIASSLGSRVYPGPEREIGWFPVQAVPGTTGFAFPAELTVFHWHGETFDLPAGAVRLAGSTVVPNQAFQLGPRVVGLQFHLEMTVASIATIAAECASDLTPGPWVQAESELLPGYAVHGAATVRLLDSLLAYLTR